MDTPFCSETGGIRGFQSLDPSVNRTAVIETTDYSAELEAREGMRLRIMDLARELGIDFAFPTRTLAIEAPPDADVRHPGEAFGAILGRR